MNDKAKARKLEDRNPVRGQSTSLSPMGPGMVPHHNYGIPSESYPSGGRLAYRSPGLTQLMTQMGPPLSRGLSNDMGPPIFMPSLNLGTPKPPSSRSTTASSTATVTVVSLSNSKLRPQQSMTTSGPHPPPAFMPDMMSYPQASPLSPFTPLNPVSYNVGPPPSKATVPMTSIAKPTPISMTAHSKGGVTLTTKVVPGPPPCSQPVFSGGGKQPKTASSQGVAKLLPSSEAGGGIKGEGHGNVFVSGGRYPQAPPISSPMVSCSLSKMLLTSTHQQQQVLAVSSPVSKPAGGGGGGYLGADGYSVRSPVMVPVVPPTPATSGQPSSNASFADTRLDRPPQPSAPHVPLPGGPTPGAMPLPPGSSLASKDSAQPKERLTTAEVASNIIISNPGLTGKHIAAMTNTTQSSSMLPQQTPYPPSISQSGLPPSELLSGPGMVNLPLHQQMVDGSGWGFSPQHNSNHIYGLPPAPVSMATSSGVTNDMLIQQSNGGGLKSRLESTATSTIPHSPLGGGGGGGGVEQGMSNSPGQTNSSPRPRILRPKRPVDGNWRLDGQSNSMHSPGSPHRTKLNTLKKSIVTSLSSEQGPTSPTGVDTLHPQNHVGGGRGMEIGDYSGSPRKKPRKQNVVANDDQYASNVPDTQQHSLSEEMGHFSDERSKSSSCRSGGRPGRVSPGNAAATKELEIRYLSQLRKSPYPINGVYKLRHHSANNHFRRYADIRHKEELPLSVYDLANNKSSQQRASGWKLYHFSSQLDEMGSQETSLLVLMERMRSSLGCVAQNSTCLLDKAALRSTEELIQGNIDRSNRVGSHIESTRSTMFTVLDHKSQVLDILDKYSNFKSHYSSISPSLSSSSSSHHHKSHS